MKNKFGWIYFFISIALVFNFAVYFLWYQDWQDIYKVDVSAVNMVDTVNLNKNNLYIDTDPLEVNLNTSKVGSQFENYGDLLAYSKMYKTYFYSSKDGLKLDNKQDFYNRLYLNSDSQDISVWVKYNNIEDYVSIYTKSIKLSIGGKVYDFPETEIYRIEEAEKGGVLKFGSRYIYVDETLSFSILLSNLLKSSIEYYQFDNNNLLEGQEYNFENGPWLKNAQSCDMVNDSQYDYTLNQDIIDINGKKYLQLGGQKTLSCTYNHFKLNFDNTKVYLVLLDHKQNQNQDYLTSKYNISIKNDKDTSFNQGGSFIDLYKNTKTPVIINLPINNIQSNGVTINLYSDSQKIDKPSQDMFGGVEIFKIADKPVNISLKKIQDIADDPGYVRVEKGHQFDVEYIGTGIDQIKDQNSSFDKGLWNERVADCSSTNPGEAKISADINYQENNSLHLYSENHSACSNKTFNVNFTEDMLYTLSFKYKSLSGDLISYYYKLEDTENLYKNDTEETGYGDIKVEKNSNWQTQEIIVNKKSIRANKISLYFYSKSDGSKTVSNLYDDIKIQEYRPINFDTYYLGGQNHTEYKYKDTEIEVNSEEYSNDFKNVQVKTTLDTRREKLLILSNRKYDTNNRMYDMYNKNINADYYPLNNKTSLWFVDLNAACNNNQCEKNSDKMVFNTYIKLYDKWYNNRLFIFIIFNILILFTIIYLSLKKKYAIKY